MSDGCDYMIPADRGTPPTRCGEPVTHTSHVWDSGYGGRATYWRCAKHSGEMYAVVRVSNQEACLKCCPTCTDTRACSLHCAAYSHPAGACRSSGATSTESRLEAIRKRAEAVPPGPWEVAPHSIHWRSICLPAGDPPGLVIGDIRPEVAEFVAGARDDIPWLVDEIQKHTTEKARLVGEFRRLAGECEVRAGSEGILDQIEQLTLAAAWTRAAKMVEESKP